MKQFKNIILFISVLISLKITYLAGYLYLKMPIGIILKLLQVSDENAYEYLWQYLPLSFESFNINLNPITMISISSIDLLLMQGVIISWICYFFIKTKKNNIFFIANSREQHLTDCKKMLNLGVLIIIFCIYCYYLIDILTLTYNDNEILEILKPTYFLRILQALIGYNIIVHGITLSLIFQTSSWSLLQKILLSIILIFFCISYCYSLANVLIWKEGGISIFLNKQPIDEHYLYLVEAIYKIYQYYGFNISFCNPESLNPCLEIKKQMELACNTKETIDQLPIYGRSLRSNIAGYVPSLYTDYRFGCSSMKKMLQTCIDSYMQDNFVNNWNLKHNPVISYHIPREPITIKIPKV